MDTTVVSFPGLGIGEMTINKIAFTVGSIEVRWYGIIITLGIIAGFCYALYRSKHEGIKYDDVIDYAIWTVLIAVIGARVYYVLTTLGDGLYHSFYDVIAIWEGGIAIYGAVIGGAVAILIVSKVKKFSKQNILKMFDMVAPGVMLGQIIGRWGNFVNGEAHGIKTSESFFLRMGLNGGAAVHPTFLYESLWNLLGFVLINILYKKKKFDGQVLLMYLAWYGFGRMFIEGLRTDSLYVGAFRISQVVGFFCFVIGTSLLVYFLARGKRAVLDTADYAPVYERSRGAASRTKEKSEQEREAEADIDAMIARAAQKNEKKEENDNGEADCRKSNCRRDPPRNCGRHREIQKRERLRSRACRGDRGGGPCIPRLRA